MTCTVPDINNIKGILMGSICQKKFRKLCAEDILNLEFAKNIIAYKIYSCAILRLFSSPSNIYLMIMC